MSWESTSSYYKALNEGVKEALGGLHSAQICMYSVDFQEIETLQRQGEWAQAATILGRAAWLHYGRSRSPICMSRGRPSKW